MALATNSRPVTPGVLKLIRAALLFGVLAFGAVAWFLHRTEGQATISPEDAGALRLGFVVLVAMDALMLLLVRSRQRRAADFQTAAVTTIIGWALGEGVALLGGVIYMLTADPTLYLAGVVFLAVSFLVVPVPEAR